MAEMTTLHKIQGTSPVCFAQRFKNFVVANVYHFGFNTVCQGNRATFLMRHDKMKVERALLVKRCWWKLKEFWVFLWIIMDFDRFSWIFMDFLLPFLFLQASWHGSTEPGGLREQKSRVPIDFTSKHKVQIFELRIIHLMIDYDRWSCPRFLQIMTTNTEHFILIFSFLS